MANLTEIAAFGGTAVAFANALFTGWWYVREMRRHAERNTPIAEIESDIPKSGNYINITATVRNTKRSSIVFEKFEVLKPNGLILHSFSGRLDESGEFEVKSHNSTSVEMNSTVKPVGSPGHHVIPNSGDTAQFRYLIPITELKGGRIQVRFTISWQNPRFQRIRLLRTTHIRKSELEVLKASVSMDSQKT